MATSELLQQHGWLGLPPNVNAQPQDSDNPFLRFRGLLWCYHRAMQAGWSDATFVELVERIDGELKAAGGPGFVVTPFAPSASLGAAVKADLWVKDETGSVGGSHKARHLMGIALHLAVDNQDAPLAISSCGNAALGAATVAAALKRELTVFVPDWADPLVLDQIQSLGGSLEVCQRAPDQLGDPCMAAFTQAVGQGSVPFSVQGTVNPWAIDGGRLLGWELIHQSDGKLDDLVVQVGGGALASSTFQAFFEARELGVIGNLPRLHAVQTVGCAPLDRALTRLRKAGGLQALGAAAEQPDLYMTPWETPPTSAATGILDDVTYDWLGIAEGVLGSDGQSVVVTEAQVEQGFTLARERTEIPVCVTGSVGLAGVLALGEKLQGNTVGVLFTGKHRG